MPRVLIPRPYQKLIINFITEHKRCNVFAGMGLGKTVSTLTAMESLYLSGVETQPTLVLAPLRVAASTWPDESTKWEHLSGIEIQPIIGGVKERAKALSNDNASVFTCNYENIAWLVEELGNKWPFGTVIADESTRLKSFRLRGGGKRAAALGKVAFKHVHRWINLSGTPAPNGLIDLWGQQWFIDKGDNLGRTYGSFTDRWFKSIQFPGQAWSKLEIYPHSQAEIQKAISPLTISLDAADWFDIQEPICNTVRVSLPSKVRKHYNEMEKEMYMELEGGGVEALNAAAKTIKCLQIASGAIYTDDNGSWEELHTAKLQALESIIAEAAGMPVLVAYHWKHDLERLMKAFPAGRYLDKDPQTLRDWNVGKIPVMFAHPASAGHGLNMQDGGNILVFMSPWWNLEEYQQIIERIGPTRQAQAGHPRPVYIYSIVAENTVDELVIKARESKKTVQEILLSALKK